MEFCNKEIIRRIDSFIQKNKEQIIEDLANLVRIPSVLGESSSTAPFGEDCKKVLDEIKELYKRNGYYSKIDNKNKYILSYYGNDAGKQIGIFSHADVVPVDDDWLITKPFEPIIKNGFMFGRGCNDDKSGIIQALYAAEIIKELELPFKSELVMFAGTNEESGMEDIKAFCENEKMPNVSLVPDGEYPFYSGEKTIIKFDIISKNKTKTIKNIKGGKASNIILGELFTELYYSAELWQEIQNICSNDAPFEIKNDSKVIFIRAKGKPNHIANINNSINAAKITAEMLLKCNSINEEDKILLQDIVDFIGDGYGAGFGIAHNDIEFGNLVCGNGIVDITSDGRLKLTFDVRCSPLFDEKEVIHRVCEIVNINWDISVSGNSKGYFKDENQAISRIIKDVYRYMARDINAVTLKTSGGTYARMLTNAYAIGNIAPYKVCSITLPDGHGGVHQPDEKLSIDGFLEGIKILVCLIMEIDSFLNN